MPFSIVKKKNCYSVIGRDNKKVYSKCTTLDKAKKQIKLVYMIDKKKNVKRK